MRRLAPLFAIAVAVAVAGCGGSGGGTTTVTITETGPAPDTKGATEAEPPPQDETGERIDVGDFFAFGMPSKRIGCAAMTDPTTLRCDTAFPTRFSRSGRRCEFGDFGQAFLLRRSGAAKPICAGDTVVSAGQAHTIPYGKTWLLGPFKCTSRKSGLSCENGEGHGLALSLQAQKVF